MPLFTISQTTYMNCKHITSSQIVKVQKLFASAWCQKMRPEVPSQTITMVTGCRPYLTGAISTVRRWRSCSGIACQVNCRFQSNPPMLVDFALLYWYLSVSSSMTSITGQTTFDLFSAIRSKSGSNQPACQEGLLKIVIEQT